MIPEDWDAKQIRDVCSLINGRGFKPHEWQTIGLPIIRIQNLNGSEDFNYYSGPYNPKILIEHGQLLFAWSGSRGTSFGPHIWNGGRALLNYHTWKVMVNESRTNLHFLLHALRQLTGYIETQAHGASALVHVQKWEMEKFLIPLPSSLLEQQSIVTALSDIDALITSLDKLIAKKRDIKQATMQQLLTGKTRLPGFNGELEPAYRQTEAGMIPDDWEVKKLRDVADFLDGRRKPVKESDRAKMRGEYPYYGASGVVDYVDDYIFDEELILLGEDGENILSRNCKLAFQVSGKIWVNNHAHVLKPKTNMDLSFLTEYLESLDYGQFNTGTAQPKLNKRVCSEIVVFLPSLLEQQAIATVLSDMDAEIVALEQKREKTRMLKQGMMQELLTGKIRLV